MGCQFQDFRLKVKENQDLMFPNPPLFRPSSFPYTYIILFVIRGFTKRAVSALSKRPSAKRGHVEANLKYQHALSEITRKYRINRYRTSQQFKKFYYIQTACRDPFKITLGFPRLALKIQSPRDEWDPTRRYEHSRN